MGSTVRRVALVVGVLLLAASLGTGPAAGSPGPATASRTRSTAGPGPLRPRARVAGPATSPAATGGVVTPMAPSVVSTFDALPRVGGNWPADPSGAIGQQWIMTAVNTSFALYDRTTYTAVVGPGPLNAGLGLPAGTQVFDPKVVYDQYAGTFVTVFLAVNDLQRRSWIYLVIVPETTATDQATWCWRKLPADGVPGDGKQWGDYPGLGYDADRLTVTTNQFGFDGRSAYAQILSFDKVNLYDCAQTPQPVVFSGRSTRNPDGSQAFTIQPATTVGSDPTDQYLVSFDLRSRDSLTLWRIRMTSAGPTLRKTAIAVRRVGRPPYGTQAGGRPLKADTWWDTGDLRLVNAWYDADLDRVYVAHAVARNLEPDKETGGYDESAIRWYEVAPGAALRSSTVQRSGTIGEAETDAGWPVVGTDAIGNVWVTYSRASLPRGEYLSAWAAMIPPGSRSAQTTLLAAGTGRMEAVSGTERWGDFNGVSRDPLDAAQMALVNQYAVGGGTGPSDRWQEMVAIVRDG